MVTNPKRSPESEASRNWLDRLAYNAGEIVVPETADCEVRRELLEPAK
jgi:hypothetical protein